MFRELISIFRGDNPLGHMGDNFAKMLGLSQDQTIRAGQIFFSKPPSPEKWTQIYKQDVKVNKLERKIRKQLIAHLSIAGNAADGVISVSTLIVNPLFANVYTSVPNFKLVLAKLNDVGVYPVILALNSISINSPKAKLLAEG